MGNCAFCINNYAINHQPSRILVEVCSHDNEMEPNLVSSPKLETNQCFPDQKAIQFNSLLSSPEEMCDANNINNKKIVTPIPTATALSQKAKGNKQRGSRFASFSNLKNIIIYVFGPIKSGKTSLIHTFWNGLLHPFNSNEPYVHTESDEIIEKIFQSNSKQYEIEFRVPCTRNIKKNENFNEYYLILFALNEINQFEEAKEIYSTFLIEHHHRKKDHNNSLSYSNVIMIGTKSDLEKVVKEEDIDLYVKEKGLMYFEMTMKNNKMLNTFLQTLVTFSEQNSFLFGGK